MKIGSPYTPLPLEGNAVFFPSTLGGGNWGGVSVDTLAGLLFVNVMNVAQWGHMEKRGSEFVRTSAYGRVARFWNRETRVPCQNPPFGELIAVDLASGDVSWINQSSSTGGSWGPVGPPTKRLAIGRSLTWCPTFFLSSALFIGPPDSSYSTEPSAARKQQISVPSPLLREQSVTQ